MDKFGIKKKLTELGIAPENVLIDEPMASHTSFKIGGPADVFVTCDDAESLRSALRFVCENDIAHYVLGNGSNVLVSDKGYRGVVLRLGKEFSEVELCEDGVTIRAGSAVLLSRISAFAASHALSGMEFAAGIPGSLGGALYMNAGAYGGEMKDVVTRVTLLSQDGKTMYTASGDEMEFSYRHSRAEEDGSIVLGAELLLVQGNKDEIKARIAELAEKRSGKQPLNYPSAGSTFKRPVGGYAAALIDAAGLKGLSVGGAQVSEKHAGFVINTGSATCEDVLQLMDMVKDKVFDLSGIELEPEVRIIGEF